MAKRAVFVPALNGRKLVSPIEFEFPWSAGLAPIQKRKNIKSLHAVAKSKRNIDKVLEISTKSEDQLGVALSAFNLQLTLANGSTHNIEQIFQAGKVFEKGGPFIDILNKTASAAKTDVRLRNSGKLVGFRLEESDWGLEPTTSFYDWLYLSGLKQHPELAEKLIEFEGFTDIEFNPAHSINCQAAAAALYVSLVRRKELDQVLASPENFMTRMTKAETPVCDFH